MGGPGDAAKSESEVIHYDWRGEWGCPEQKNWSVWRTTDDVGEVTCRDCLSRINEMLRSDNSSFTVQVSDDK